MHWSSMRKILYIAIITLLAIACSGKRNEEPDIAGTTACLYYQQLISGKCDDYVGGVYGTQSASDDYRRQLVDNAKMLCEQHKHMHGGIDSVKLLRTVRGADNHCATAFLSLKYKDKTEEEIAVAMVEKNNIWYMK